MMPRFPKIVKLTTLVWFLGTGLWLLLVVDHIKDKDRPEQAYINWEVDIHNVSNDNANILHVYIPEQLDVNKETYGLHKRKRNGRNIEPPKYGIRTGNNANLNHYKDVPGEQIVNIILQSNQNNSINQKAVHEESNGVRGMENSLVLKPVEHVAFLKVHKTASTTVQNIFLRFGWVRNLTFVLPAATSSSYLGFPNIISLTESLTTDNILPVHNGGHYDIMCTHVLYENEAFRKFLPRDTTYIGILRNPFEQFKSIVKYMKPVYLYNGSYPVVNISDFLRNPKRYEPNGTPNFSWTNNRMAVEFGIPYGIFDHYDELLMQEYLKKLSEEFQLVLIAELLDESVVLMRRVLRWETKDVLYLNQNVLHLPEQTLTPFDRWFHKRHAKIDYALYEYFYKRLRHQIREQGVDFDEELLAFREIRLQTKEFCQQQEDVTPLQFEGTAWGRPFHVSKEDCRYMLREEIDFISQMKLRQNGSENNQS